MTTLSIHKYTLTGDKTNLEVPEDYQVLDAQVQRSKICLWLLVNPAKPKHKMVASVYGTGWDIKLEADGDIGWYAGTVQCGDLVWHVFLKDEVQA